KEKFWTTEDVIALIDTGAGPPTKLGLYENGTPLAKPPNSDRRSRRAELYRLFVKQVGRQAQKGVEPNDRRFDPEVAKSVRKMRPEEFDALLRDGDEEESST